MTASAGRARPTLGRSPMPGGRVNRRAPVILDSPTTSTSPTTVRFPNFGHFFGCTDLMASSWPATARRRPKVSTSVQRLDIGRCRLAGKPEDAGTRNDRLVVWWQRKGSRLTDVKLFGGIPPGLAAALPRSGGVSCLTATTRSLPQWRGMLGQVMGYRAQGQGRLSGHLAGRPLRS